MIINLVGTADLLDDAFVEYGDAVGQGQRLLLVMGYIYRSNPEPFLKIF